MFLTRILSALSTTWWIIATSWLRPSARSPFSRLSAALTAAPTTQVLSTTHLVFQCRASAEPSSTSPCLSLSFYPCLLVLVGNLLSVPALQLRVARFRSIGLNSSGSLSSGAPSRLPEECVSRLFRRTTQRLEACCRRHYP